MYVLAPGTYEPGNYSFLEIFATPIDEEDRAYEVRRILAIKMQGTNRSREGGEPAVWPWIWFTTIPGI